MSEQYFGITDTGFNPKPIDILESDAKALLKQYFGDNVDLTQQSPLWRLIQVGLVEISQLWTTAEADFYSCYMQTGIGVALDLLGGDIGLTRKVAVASAVELTITKNTTQAVTVPAGSLFQTVDGIIFATNDEITIASGDPASHTGTVESTCTTEGLNGNVGQNTITVITNVISGVESVNNSSPALGGKDQEIDIDYRKRLMEYVRSTWTAESIRSSALNVDGVAGVKILEHDYSYDCLVVPTGLWTTDLENAISVAIEKVTPITVEYNVLEAETVGIVITAHCLLDPLFDLSSANAQASVKVASYISGLGINENVVLAKVIQSIMDVEGITNLYTIVMHGTATAEKHTFHTGTTVYNLNYTTNGDIDSITGTVSGNPHTFVHLTDYSYDYSGHITWLGATEPDDDTVFAVTYTVPADVLGDVEILTQCVARLNSLTLQTP